MLATGTKAPNFILPDQNGIMRSLSEFQGQKVILYFYPKDMTSGCTKQAFLVPDTIDPCMMCGDLFDAEIC